jgi:hypothetical protein
MQNYIKKMIAEAEELDGRIKRAENALNNPPYGIDTTGLHLLEKQVQAMKFYSDCLRQRIKYEGEK